MDNRTLGLGIVALGAAAILVGLVVWAGGLSWFGRLPGDVRVENGSVRVYFPITSMLLVSAAASAVLWLVRRLS
jgi:hypothetical protein